MAVEHERGNFIVLEGQGFSGKTEQAHPLVERLEQQGFVVVETQEPGGVASALAIRDELLQRRKAGTITPEQEVELFYKSRGRFLDELVVPAVEDGKWVVSTRFSASTFVYQGREGGIRSEIILELDDKIVGAHQPDLYLLLDVDAEEIIRRMTQANLGRELHGYNELDPNIIANRRQYYLGLAKENRHGNWVIIDGNGSKEEISERIWQATCDRFAIGENA